LTRNKAQSAKPMASRVRPLLFPYSDGNRINGAICLLESERERRTRLRERFVVLRREEIASRRAAAHTVHLYGRVRPHRAGDRERAKGEVDTFLTGELMSARAEGIHYLIDVQDADTVGCAA
jgi:hypothetical protein